MNLREVWQYRELLYFLVWRDIKIRYKQTALGAGWAVIQPVMTMMVFSLFFGRLAKMPSDGLPYPLFALAGLVPWMFFSNGLTQASNSLVSNSHLISKVYFPRVIIPVSSVISGLADFSIGSLFLLGTVLYYGVPFTANIVWIPALLGLALVTALGVGFWLSAVNVRYRDVRYTVPFLTQFWMFATPIAYPSSLLDDRWRTLYGLNPMVGVIEGFRWALLGAKTQPVALLITSAAAALLLLLTGALYFRRMERSFADEV